MTRPATKAAIAPTERSSPPPVMTSVCPTAIVAMNVLRASTLVRLSKLEETRIDQRAEHADQRQRQERRDRAELDAPPRRGDRRLVHRLRHACAPSPFASTPVASTTMACSVIASPATSPTIRPLRMTMIR